MMEVFYAFLFAGVLSVDSFSAAFAMGFRPHNGVDALKFALSSGLSEGLLSAVGVLFGGFIIAHIAAYDHWIAFTLLICVGIHMIFESVRKIRTKGGAERDFQNDKFHGFGRIVLISLVTSLDALGVGMGLGIVGKSWILYSLMIGMVAFLSTLIGLKLAKHLTASFGPICEIFGGMVLIALAFPMLKI